MHRSLVLISFLVLSMTFPAHSQTESLIGAWKTLDEDNNFHYLIIAEGFFSDAVYTDDKFLYTYGGEWIISNNKILMVNEFHSKDTSTIGKSNEYPMELKTGKLLSINNQDWKRIDDGTPGKLCGAWLITGRLRDGEIRRRTPGSRKTMKILSGTRFQWIAYDVDKRAFRGTGGGTYTTKGGKYVESIDFFSRDQSRVSASLSFDFELKDGDWVHRGKSSKGAPLHEIWSKRTQ